MNNRLPWDEYFFGLATNVSERATCSARKVGALIVHEKRILATGYNGSPPGQPHCTEVGCLLEEGRCVRTIHAEQNALMQCALYGISSKGSTLYCTCRPCWTCSKLVLAAGILRVVAPLNRDKSWEYLESSGIEMSPI